MLLLRLSAGQSPLAQFKETDLGITYAYYDSAL